MKKYFTIILLIIIVFKSYSQNSFVYICSGPYAVAYHNDPRCKGLNNCKSQIDQVTINYAISIKNRRPCCICVSQYGCIEDQNDIIKFNPYVPQGGGGGSSSNGGTSPEAAGYIAAGIIGVGAAVLSNDFYLSTFTSNNQRFNNNNRYIQDRGYSFGLRKTNGRSTFEYGASFIAQNDYSGEEGGDTKWGGHFNYLYGFPISNSKINSQIFLGATINSFFTKNDPFGAGGIVGTNINLLKWLKFDARYEISTTTDRLSTGLIIKYQ